MERCDLLGGMLEEGHAGRGLPLPRAADLVSANVAARFGLAGKGRSEVGADADLALVDLGSGFVLGEDDLFYPHNWRPFVDRRFRGRSCGRWYAAGRSSGTARSSRRPLVAC